MAHSKVDNTFNGAMDKIKELSSVFREGGKLEAACGDDCDLGDVRSAFEKLMGEMREAHTEATMEESMDEGKSSGDAYYIMIHAKELAAADGLDPNRLSYGDLQSYTKKAKKLRGIDEGKMSDMLIHDSETLSKEEFAKKHGKDVADEYYEATIGAPDYNPAAGEYASEREYGMFSDEGNAEVAEIVDDIIKRHERGEFDSPERAIDAAMKDLMNLSDDNKDFEEASDTDVMDQVARDLDRRIGRDSGFGEAIEYMRKLAGIEQ